MTLIVLLFTAIPAYASGGIVVMIDEDPMTFTSNQGYPSIIEGRTFVPLRAVFEALGAQLNYDPSTKSIEASKGERIINLTVNKEWAKVGKEIKKLNAPPRLINNRTYVPLRFIGEALGCQVDFAAKSNIKTITITTADETNNESEQAEEKETSEFKIENDGTSVEGLMNYGGELERGEDFLRLKPNKDSSGPLVLAADNNKLVEAGYYGVYEATFKFNSFKGNAGYVFNVSSPKVGNNQFKGFYVGIDPDQKDSTVIIGKMNNKWNFIKGNKIPIIRKDKYYTLKTVKVADRIDVYVNDIKYISISDSDYAKPGYFGPRLWNSDVTYKYMGYKKDVGDLKPKVFSITNPAGEKLTSFRIFGGEYEFTDTLTLFDDKGKEIGPKVLPFSTENNKSLEVFPASGIYEAKFDFLKDGGSAGFVFSVSRPGVGNNSYQGYYVCINHNADTVKLGKANYDWEILKEEKIPSYIAKNTNLTLKVRKDYNIIRVYLNGTEIFTVNDDSFESGYFGPRVWDTNAKFEYLKAESL